MIYTTAELAALPQQTETDAAYRKSIEARTWTCNQCKKSTIEKPIEGKDGNNICEQCAHDNLSDAIDIHGIGRPGCARDALSHE